MARGFAAAALFYNAGMTAAQNSAAAAPPQSRAAAAGGAPPLLALVVPCYNEEEALPIALQTLGQKLQEWKARGVVDGRSFACFVDDGSQDATWQILQNEGACHRIRLAANAGHQNALFAGLRAVAELADCCVTLDADLQDDVDVIPQMLARFGEGADVVYGARDNRDSDTFFKRNLAGLFYALGRLLGLKTPRHHADFRLMSRRCLRVLAQYDERHLFLRGVVPALNLPSAVVFYARRPRVSGEAKYGFFGLLALAINGITSFSIAPLRFIAGLGFFISLLAFGHIAHTFYVYFVHGERFVAGWASLIVSLYFLGGLILLALGVVGEYIGKIFEESKKRPLYVVEEERRPQQ